MLDHIMISGHTTTCLCGTRAFTSAPTPDFCWHCFSSSSATPAPAAAYCFRRGAVGSRQSSAGRVLFPSPLSRPCFLLQLRLTAATPSPRPGPPTPHRRQGLEPPSRRPHRLVCLPPLKPLSYKSISKSTQNSLPIQEFLQDLKKLISNNSQTHLPIFWHPEKSTPMCVKLREHII